MDSFFIDFRNNTKFYVFNESLNEEKSIVHKNNKYDLSYPFWNTFPDLLVDNNNQWVGIVYQIGDFWSEYKLKCILKNIDKKIVNYNHNNNKLEYFFDMNYRGSYLEILWSKTSPNKIEIAQSDDVLFYFNSDKIIFTNFIAIYINDINFILNNYNLSFPFGSLVCPITITYKIPPIDRI